MKLLSFFLMACLLSQVYGATYHADEVWFLRDNWEAFQDGDLIILDAEKVYLLLPFKTLNLTFSGEGAVFFVDDISFNNLTVQGAVMNLREHSLRAVTYTQRGGLLANGTLVTDTVATLEGISYENLVVEGTSAKLENVSCLREEEDSSHIRPEYLQANESCLRVLEVVGGELLHSHGTKWSLEETSLLHCNVSELEADFFPEDSNSVAKFQWTLNETLLVEFNTSHVEEVSANHTDFHGDGGLLLGNDFLLNVTQFFGPGDFELNRLVAEELLVNCSGETRVTVEFLEVPLIALECTYLDGYVLIYRESSFNITNPELEVSQSGDFFYVSVRPTEPLPVYPDPHNKATPSSSSSTGEEADVGAIVGVTVASVVIVAGLTALTIFLVKRNAKKQLPAYRPLIHK